MSNSLFRLNVRHIDQMNTQVWLLNLLVCLANSMQFLQFQLKHLLKCLTFCLFPLLTRIAELQNVPCQNRRIGNYSTFTPVKVMSFCTYFQVKPMKIVPAVTCISLSINQITRLSNLSICVDDEKGTPDKPHCGLPQAYHGNI